MKTETHWINTQKGFDFDITEGNNGGNSIPNTPVTYHYLTNCPESWVKNEWVREATKEEHEAMVKTNDWEKSQNYFKTLNH